MLYQKNPRWALSLRPPPAWLGVHPPLTGALVRHEGGSGREGSAATRSPAAQERLAVCDAPEQLPRLVLQEALLLLSEDLAQQGHALQDLPRPDGYYQLVQ